MAASSTAPQDAGGFAFPEFLRDGGEVRIRRCVDRIARRFAGADADEVVQEVLMRAHLRHRVNPFVEPDVLPWCATVARNLFLDMRRSDARRRTLPLHLVRDVDASEPDHAEATAQTVTLHAALRALPRRQAAVVWATEAEQHSQADVAAALGTSVGSVKQLRHRALEALRQAVITTPALLVLATVFGAVRFLRRTRHLPYPAMGVSLAVLVIAPVVGPSRLLPRTPRPATQQSRDHLPVRERRPEPDNVRAERAAGPRHHARPPASDPSRRVGTTTGGPVIRTQACVAVGKQRSVCGRTGKPYVRTGDTVYVTIPGSLVGADDVTAEFHDNEIPVCTAVPTIPVGGCRREPA